MKITVQEKIAELERRIIALEAKRPTPTTTTTTRTVTTDTVDLNLEPEWQRAWTAFDAVFEKVRKWSVTRVGR